MRSFALATTVVSALAAVASAQTSSACDPTKKTCPADPALGKTVSIDFTTGASSQFTVASGETVTYGSNGATFKIAAETDAPTISSNWYIMFGKVEAVVQAAPGTGIVSSFVLLSDDLDEIDWEWIGSDTVEVQSNYYGKGNTSTYDRGGKHPVSSPQTSFHTYTIDWTSAYVKWSIDGNLVRTLNYADAVGGANFPQTPMQVKLGSWDGGASTEPAGTVQWAGGASNMANGPFNMYVKSLTVQDYTTSGSEYVYSDMSGSYQSIKAEGAAGGSSVNSVGPSSPSSSVAASAHASSAASSVAVASSSAKASAVASSAASSPIAAVASTASTLKTSLTTPVAATSVVPIGQAPTQASTTAGGNIVTLPTVTRAAAATNSGATSVISAATTSATGKSSAAVTSRPSRFGLVEMAIALVGLAMGAVLL